MTSQVVQSSKRALRKTMRTLLLELPRELIQTQSETVARQVLQCATYSRSSTVACYLSMPGEVDTALLVRHILRAGKTLFVPKIDTSQDGKMEMLRVYNEDDLESFVPGVWGITEPGLSHRGQTRQTVSDPDSPLLDLILVPGVAFDRSLARLGHGKGYYDRFISGYISDRSGARPSLIALALQPQLLAAGQVPSTPLDFRMDCIISPDEVIGSLG